MSTNFESLVMRGTRAAQPSAGVPGRLYYVTDESLLERDNGSSWDNIEAVSGGAGSDTTAVHDNVSGEINAVTLKATPGTNDVLLIEDSASSYAKKKITIGTLPIPATQAHDHSGDSGDGGTFDAANLTSAAVTSGYVLTADGAGGAGWAAVSGVGGALTNHDHSGDAGDGGTFDAANLTSASAAAGYVLTADGLGGASWAAASGVAASGGGTQTSMALFTVASGVVVASIPYKIYNVLGRTVTISQVFLSIDVAPTGSTLIVDVNKNGTTIFTDQNKRPVISGGAYTGFTTQIDVASWANGEYITAAVDQVGATVAGSDLVIHVVYS